MVAAAIAVGPPSCAVTDDRLTELSGLAVVDGQLWAMTDGGSRVEADRLDPVTCAVVDARTARVDPSDPEDLAVGPGGVLWVADIGDNGRDRASVAVIALPERGPATVHRLTYPDGPHDAEALLVDGAGRPVIVTKEFGAAGIYRGPVPNGEGPFPLERVGTLTLPPSDTAGGPLGSFGSSVVTGAAQTVGVIGVRSYTDAWLFPMAGGDVVAALARDPVRVPLPDEPQGEAIAFAADGTLVSGSESRDGRPAQIRGVPGAAALVGVRAATPAGSPTTARALPWSAEQSALVGGAAAVAVLALAALALALRARRR